MVKSLNKPALFALFCGVIVSCVGVVVLYGWFTQNNALIQVLPHFAPMQFNTALGYLFAGLGLVSVSVKYSDLASILGFCCALLGALTLAQYILGVDFGIDELFMDAQVMVRTSHPGRMAPNTALCFTLTGLTFLFGRRNRQLQISIATTIIVLSMLAFFAYLTNVEGLYGWGNLTRMAIHTASCFLIFGVGTVVLGIYDDKTRKIDLWNLVPLILSSTVVVLSLLSWQGIKESTQIRNDEYFDRLVSDTSDVLLNRYALYEQSLLGGVGMFAASEVVERLEWRAYVDALNIEESLPGIAGIGVIAPVQSFELADYLEDVRQDNAPNFVNKPGTSYSDKFIITYIEPESFNEKAIGLDIGFESNRREAAEYSRDSGLHMMTKKIVLVQDGQQTPGFLLLVPFYYTDSIPDTVEQRREHFRGWVYAPFIASDFMEGLTLSSNGQLAFNVYDGAEVNSEAQIYSSNSDLQLSQPYQARTQLNLAGRQWTVDWFSTETYTPVASQNNSTIVLVWGMLGAAMLYLTLLRLLRSKEIIAREVDKKTHLLASSERRLQLVFDNAGEGILGLDMQGCITFANRAAQVLLGYSLMEMRNSNFHDLVQHTRADGTSYKESDSNIFAMLKHGEKHAEAEEVFWHKKGIAVPVEYTGEPIEDEDGGHSGGVLVFRDIAARKAAEAEIKQANEELEEFAYRTSHDLRSPLISSITLLGMAEKAIHDDNKKMALTSVSHSQNSLQKLEVLVKDILVLTQTKNEQEEDKAVDVSALIDEAIDKLRYMENFERLDIQLDLAFSDALKTKRNRVSLIVENLISNAVKYQDLSKKTSFLKIATYKSDDNFVMVFEDNGLGIPKDQQHKMFEMFKRFHPRTSFGTGLGLYMMKKSADILGGEIRFEDSDEGALFKLLIPLTSC